MFALGVPKCQLYILSVVDFLPGISSLYYSSNCQSDSPEKSFDYSSWSVLICTAIDGPVIIFISVSLSSGHGTNVWIFLIKIQLTKSDSKRTRSEYMFLLGGNTMPGTEKFWGELLFPEEKMVVFSTEGRKNNFFWGKQMFFSEFFWPRHNVFKPVLCWQI